MPCHIRRYSPVLVCPDCFGSGLHVESRRRLFLLAVILVAVAIGAVSITLVSLFATAVEQERSSLASSFSDPVPAAADRQVAWLSARDGAWRVDAGAVPAVILDRLPEEIPSGSVQWLEDPPSDYLVAMRAGDEGRLQLAWLALEPVRAPYRQAALHALGAICVLVVGGVWLFYRMTAPLLRNMALNEARYRTLFSSTAEGVVLVGVDRDRIEECNDRFCELFFCRREEVVGCSWREFFVRHAGGSAALARFEARLSESMKPNRDSFVWEFERTGHGVMVAEIAFRSLQDADRQLVLVSLRDVSERERTVRELQAAERALRESRERLAQAGRSSALIELAAGFAHEVNQPLAAISGYAQACRRQVQEGGTCSPDVAASLDRIAEQAQRAGEAIQRIRSLVRPQDQREDVTCVNRLVESVILLLGEEIETSGTRLVLALSPDVEPVRADPIQIQQVLVQLLHNALEAMAGTPREERCIELSTRLKEGQVEVSLCDTGHGISEDDRAFLFDPFYSTRENGMGMGLTISMSIIRSHQGMIEIDESREQGACIRFRLPVDTTAAGRDERCRKPDVP